MKDNIFYFCFMPEYGWYTPIGMPTYDDFIECCLKIDIEKLTIMDWSEEYAEQAADWLLENGTNVELQEIPPIIERFFPNFRHELEDAIAEREALRKSDETAYEHYVK